MPTRMTADVVARRLLLQEGLASASGDGDILANEPVIATADRVDALWTRLGLGLGASCGPDAYRSLLERTLLTARSSHPALRSLQLRAEQVVAIDGWDAVARVHGAAALAGGVQDVLCSLVGLLERLIGPELAEIIVSQALTPPVVDPSAPSPRGPVATP